jgi:hypothetical protein
VNDVFRRVELTLYRYTHAVTGEETAGRPSETGGGILADEMGLGKTLTMLSVISETITEAASFAKDTNSSAYLGLEHTLIPSKATLIIVPSPCKQHPIRRVREYQTNETQCFYTSGNNRLAYTLKVSSCMYYAWIDCFLGIVLVLPTWFCITATEE